MSDLEIDDFDERDYLAQPENLAFFESLTPEQLYQLYRIAGGVIGRITSSNLVTLLDARLFRDRKGTMIKVAYLMVDSDVPFVRECLLHMMATINDAKPEFAKFAWAKLLGDSDPTVRQLARRILAELIEEHERLATGPRFLSRMKVPAGDD